MGDKTAVELHMDVIRKSHLPDKCLIDPGRTRDLPAKHLQGFLADNGPRVADRIASHIPDASASQFRQQAHIPFTGEHIAKGTTDQLQGSQGTVFDHFLTLRVCG